MTDNGVLVASAVDAAVTDTWLDHYDAACAKAVRAAHAQRLANMPLRPKVAQEPRHDGGLFGDAIGGRLHGPKKSRWPDQLTLIRPASQARKGKRAGPQNAPYHGGKS